MKFSKLLIFVLAYYSSSVFAQDTEVQEEDAKVKNYIIVFPNGHATSEKDQALKKLNRLVKRSEHGAPVLLDTHHVHEATVYVAAVHDGHVNVLKREFSDAIIAEDGPVWGSAVQTQNNPPWGLSRISRRLLSTAQEDFEKNKNEAYVKNMAYVYEDALFGNSRDLRVYVLDTGVDVSKTNEINLTSGPTFIPGTTSSNDDNGHGTVVAGIVGSKTYGVAKGVQITSVKILDSKEKGNWSVIIKGLSWVAEDIRAKNCTRAVINMSLNGGINAAADRVIQALAESGVNIVVSAGNANENACNNSPGHLKSVIVVGASNKYDERWNEESTLGSNYGNCIDVMAPGENVLSTTPSFTGKDANAWSGTSMAAPHVAGVVATYLAANGRVDPPTMKEIIVNRSTENVLVDTTLNGSPNRLLYSFSPEYIPSCPPILKFDDMMDSSRLFGQRLTSNGAPATDYGTVKRKFIMNTEQSRAVVLVPSASDAKNANNPFFSFSFTDYENAASTIDSCFDASSYDFLSFYFRGPSTASEVYVQASIGDVPNKCSRLVFKVKLKINDYYEKVLDDDWMSRNRLQKVSIPLKAFCETLSNIPNIQAPFGNKDDPKWCMKGLQRISFQEFSDANGYNSYAFANLKLFSICSLENVDSVTLGKVTLPNLKSNLKIVNPQSSTVKRKKRGDDGEFIEEDFVLSDDNLNLAIQLEQISTIHEEL